MLASYKNQAQWANDTQQMTVMSYFESKSVRSDHWDGTESWQYPASPMLIDILAIQNLYGADYTTRSGDTVYGFNSTAGRDQYDFTISEAPVAIWDGGGSGDVLDLSGYDTNQTIYLTQGDFSSVGNMTNNLVIAYGAEIENAIGGGGDDLIYTNNLNNKIYGDVGDDIIWGSIGDDFIQGEEGIDSIIYEYNISDFVYSFINGAQISLTNIVDGFTDIIGDVEKFIFLDGTYDFADLETASNATETTRINLFWNGGKYGNKLTENGTITLTGSDIGYDAGRDNLFEITKFNYTSNITVLDNNAPGILSYSGSDASDRITVTGAHNNFSGKIYAGGMNDIITMSIISDDKLYGDAGDDKIYAGAGHDKVYGGTGRDILKGEAGSDYIYGGNDHDIITGGSGIDFLYGDDGHDELNGNDGDDRIYGGAGKDLIFGDRGHDIINGGDGDDYINGGVGNDVIYGGAGNDEIRGDEGNDRLFGNDGDDVIAVYNGDNQIYGGEGDDILLGGEGHDRLFGGNGDDFAFGDFGDDILKGGNDNDILEGGEGNDVLYGESGSDILDGHEGNDTLYGGAGDDMLTDYDGVNELYGGAGNDTFLVWEGKNLLKGGIGNDVFDLNVIDSEVDQIRDFTLTGLNSDVINITDILENYTNGVDNINDFVVLDYKHANRTDLYIDADGGGDNFVQAATIRGADLSGTTASDLAVSGQLVTDVTLLYNDFYS